MGVLDVSCKGQVDRTLVATMASVSLTEVTGEFSKWLHVIGRTKCQSFSPGLNAW